ncbi:hypothetical protein RKE30_03775 [Streptomyces sp. Li-HN-5-11]|uniref:hypothetical protein n=1 Tax=Streptomyces sp. Li-HN-5-11 TaxID=3075432 RepID=UPI0028B1AEE8|nr:hypothetical protein [Streptomyces sp. Li-HN-5-11]WNM29571.1 hypothetical protein RKE30_03775 [Streptomyces sp. Li-HN-5-11]
MKSTTVRRITLSVAAATALTGVAACGSGSSSSSSGKSSGAAGQSVVQASPIAALRTAETSSDQADSARIETTISMGAQLSAKSSGALSWGHGVTGTQTIAFTGGSSPVAESMRRAGATAVEARYLSDAFYVRMPAVLAGQAGGKHWARYGYADIARLGGASGAVFKDQVQNNTPNRSLKLLLASGDVKKVGEATVRGQHTTHYAGTVSVADLATRTSHLPQAELDRMKQQLAKSGVTTETVDVWVNDQNLLVKKVEKAGIVATTVYFSDYGVKVSVVRPAASDTFDALQQLRKGTSANTATGGAGVAS